MIDERLFFCHYNPLQSYKVPLRNVLSGKLLKDQPKKSTEKDVSKVLADAAKFGATIASDGWSNAQRRPILNFMVVTRLVTRGRAAFMHSIDCTDHMADGGRKDSACVASKTIDAINKFGANNVVHF